MDCRPNLCPIAARGRHRRRRVGGVAVGVALLAAVGCQGPPSELAPNDEPIAPGVYTAGPGDDLSRVALRAYGDMELWYCLLNANPQLCARPEFALQPGEEIRVPPRDQLDRSLPKSKFPQELPADYIIMPGDSLPFIAQGCYGDKELWIRIYDANRDRLSSRVREDPRQIFAGKVLRIPAPPRTSADSAKETR